MENDASTTPGVTIHGIPGIDGLDFQHASGMSKQLADAKTQVFRDGKITSVTGNETFQNGEVTLVIKGPIPTEEDRLAELYDYLEKCEDSGFTDNKVDPTVESG